MLDSKQIRAARTLLGWRQEDLSKAAGIGTATIQRIEKSVHTITGYASTLARIQAAFEDAGVLFIDEDELGGIGVRLAKKEKTAMTSSFRAFRVTALSSSTRMAAGPGVRLRKSPKKPRDR